MWKKQFCIFIMSDNLFTLVITLDSADDRIYVGN